MLTARWFLRHMYRLTKWKCDTDAVMSEYKRPTVASLLSRRLRCWRAASQQLIDPATLADAKLESTLTNENNKQRKQQAAPLPHCRFEQSRQASPSLWTNKAKTAMCMPICLDVERPLDLRRWDWTRNFPRRHSHCEQKRSGHRIFGWAAAPSL